MKGEEAMEIFKIVKSKGMLPAKMEDLVPLSFIGQTAVTFYRQMIKGFDQLKMTEVQRKRTLKDGQEAGEMLLDIETRIGELLPSIEEARKDVGKRQKGIPITQREGGSVHPGITDKRAHHARAISRHPEIVEKVKAQARENEDIPTRTAVVNEIRHVEEKKRHEEAESKKTDSKGLVTVEETIYINALDRCISILPQKPPKRWDEVALKEATAKAKILIRRLEVFK